MIVVITGYQIRRTSNGEILYLYMDFQFEFASFSSKKKNEKLHETIKQYIMDHKIPFAGGLVTLVVGGVLVGTIYLNPIVDGKKQEADIEVLEVKTEKKTAEEEFLENEGEEINNNLHTNYNKDNSSENANSKDKEISNTTQSVSADSSESVDSNLYVTLKRSNGSIISVELEEYVIGVVGAEMPASFQLDALKAQAIIARTYALKTVSKGQILSDSVSTQSYKTKEELQALWGASYNTYYSKIKNAVNTTEGLYLSYNGNYIEAVYHSTSNGTTEDSLNVWGNAYPYLISVDSIYDNSNPSFEKDVSFTYSEVSAKLNDTITSDTEFYFLGKTSGGRVSFIEINGKTYRGVDFRNLMGLRSADFEIIKTDTGVVIKTRGYGHGVGMSQYGANGMAKNGYHYQDILLHYYPGVSICHL